MELGGVEVVKVASWAEFPWLRHGFSTRFGGASLAYSDLGDLNLGFTQHDEPHLVRGNRATFMRAVAGNALSEMVTVRQVHGTTVKVVHAGELGLCTEDGRAVVEADGLLTQAFGVMLGVQVADCVPVLVADTRLRVVAAFHAGWRGTAAGMVELGVAKMVADFGCEPADMVGAVGPSIGVCCYTVGEEVRERFEARFGYAEDLIFREDDGLRIDLAEGNRRQLVDAGLRIESVTVIGECTACSRVEGRRKYFSHRAEHGLTGRAMGAIGIAGR